MRIVKAISIFVAVLFLAACSSTVQSLTTNSETITSNTSYPVDNSSTSDGSDSFDTDSFIEFVSLLTTEIKFPFDGVNVTDGQAISAMYFVLNAIGTYGPSIGMDFTVTESGYTLFPIQLVREQFIELLGVEINMDIIRNRLEFLTDDTEFIGFYIGGTDGGLKRAEILQDTVQLQDNMVSINVRVYEVQYDTTSQDGGEIYQYLFSFQEGNLLAPYCLSAIVKI